VSKPLDDEALLRLKRIGGAHACEDRRILSLLRELAITHPREKIHWLGTDTEEILGGWVAQRLASGRLANLIDKAASVRGLRSMLTKDLQAYANEVRRRELPTKLFKRLKKLLEDNPERFTPVLASAKPGSTYWTLTELPARAVFSGDDAELVAHVFAVALVILEQDPEAKKETQFLSPRELNRYATQMLKRTARGVSPDQLVRGLDRAYGLTPTFTELPREDLLEDDSEQGETQPIQLLAAPAPFDDQHTSEGHSFLEALTPRQLEVLKDLPPASVKQTETAARLGCSPATISSEIDAIAAALTKWPERDEQIDVLRQAIILLHDNRP
jgi:hypothetical protein